VVRGDEVCVGGNPQLGGVRAAGFEAVDLLEKCLEVDDAAVADDGDGVGAEDAGRKELELILLTAHDDGVPGVVAAVRLHYVVDAAAKQVGGLTFSFVAPLGSDDHDCWHGILPHSFGPSPAGSPRCFNRRSAPFMRMPRIRRPNPRRWPGKDARVPGLLPPKFSGWVPKVWLLVFRRAADSADTLRL
jgi:hypothetical protein